MALYSLQRRAKTSTTTGIYYEFPHQKIFWILTGVVILLLGIYTWNVMAWHIIPAGMPPFLNAWFDIDRESAIPTWFSTILLFLVSFSSFMIFTLEKKVQVKRRWAKFWFLFGCTYLFFSMDEAAVIHESIDNFTTFKWIFFYAPVTFLFFLACAYNFIVIRKEDRILRNWIIGGLIVYSLGGLGCESANYLFQLNYAWRHVEYVAEEGLELLGSIMVLMGCLTELNRLTAVKTAALPATNDIQN